MAWEHSMLFKCSYYNPVYPNFVKTEKSLEGKVNSG